MKVYIGKYIHWWSSRSFCEAIIARRHGKEFGFEVEEEDYDWVDRAVCKFDDFWQTVLYYTVNQIQKRRQRKIKVRIDDYDVWSADHTLALIIVPILKKLKEEKHGTPYTDREDGPEDAKYNDDTDPDREPAGYSKERWEYILDEMIWAFEQILDEDEGAKNYYVPYEDVEEVSRAYWKDQNGEKNYLITLEEALERGRFDSDLYKKYMDRQRRGFILFGKYFRSLWD